MKNCKNCKHWHFTVRTMGVCKLHDRQAMSWDSCDDQEMLE